MRRFVFVFSVAALVATGCSSATAPDPGAASPGDTGPAATVPAATNPVEISPGAAELLITDPMVAVEAQWLCDVPRFAFAEADGADQLLTQLLAEAAIPRSDYEDFKSSLDHDEELRASVADAYDIVCGEV